MPEVPLPISSRASTVTWPWVLTLHHYAVLPPVFLPYALGLHRDPSALCLPSISKFMKAFTLRQEQLLRLRSLTGRGIITLIESKSSVSSKDETSDYSEQSDIWVLLGSGKSPCHHLV